MCKAVYARVVCDSANWVRKAFHHDNQHHQIGWQSKRNRDPLSLSLYFTLLERVHLLLPVILYTKLEVFIPLNLNLSWLASVLVLWLYEAFKLNGVQISCYWLSWPFSLQPDNLDLDSFYKALRRCNKFTHICKFILHCLFFLWERTSSTNITHTCTAL